MQAQTILKEILLQKHISTDMLGYIPTTVVVNKLDYTKIVLNNKENLSNYKKGNPPGEVFGLVIMRTEDIPQGQVKVF